MPQTKQSHKLHAKDTLSIYIDACKSYKAHVALSFALLVSNVILGVVMPFFASKVLADLLVRSDMLWTYFYLFIAAAAVGLPLNLIGIRNAMRLQAEVMDDLHNMAFSRLMDRSVGFYNNQVGGKLVSDALDFVAGFGQIMNVGFIAAGGFVFTTLIGLIVVFISNWIIGVCVGLMLVGLGIWTFRESRRRSGMRSERLKLSKALTSHLSDSIVNAVTVKTFAQEKNETKKAGNLSKDLSHARRRDWTATVTNETKRMGVLLFAQIVLVFVLIRLTAGNPKLFAAGIFAFTYTITLINRFFTVNTMVRQIEEVFLQASPLSELLKQQTEIQDTPGAGDLKVTEGLIVFDNVSFQYTDAPEGKYVFTGLKIVIKPGEKVGLVGHSGGGKTTLTRLLLRFDDITAGSVLIDGQDIKQVTQTSLRSNVSYVPQEPLLFHRSIRENISYGKPGASDESIIRTARNAFAHDFITGLPNGYDTVVGERGVKLSGGQRQRVAIARAMLKDAPILVLDEATSALDSESEAVIQDALWKLMEGRTAIVIAHRLSTIQRMDRIIVLDNGTITEEGSHKVLLEKKGIYASLWKRQSGGFLEE